MGPRSGKGFRLGDSNSKENGGKWGEILKNAWEIWWIEDASRNFYGD